MQKSSIMSLPDTSDITKEMLRDETTLNNIRTLLINGALNVVNNTILKDYITKEQILENIKKYTQKIEVDKYGYIGDPNYGWDCFYTSPVLFSKPIRDAHLQNSNLTEYPELLKIIEILGLTTATAFSLDDQCFVIGTQNRKSEHIKSLISNYFATSNQNTEKREINFAGRTFDSTGITNCLQLNMMSVVAKIIGEDELAKILISTYPEKDLAAKIDEITKKKGLGKDLVDSLIALNWRSKQLMTMEVIRDIDITFFKEKMEPLINALKKQNNKMQLFITTFLEQNNYDIEDYIFHHGETPGLDIRFTKEDIEFIESYNKRFSEHCEQSRNCNINFRSYFYTETPKIESRGSLWYEDDFTFVNKVITEMNVNFEAYEETLMKLDNTTTHIIDLFSEKIIPHAMKNKKLSLSPTEFEEMLGLLTFRNSNIAVSNKGTKKVQKVKKKIDKLDKKKKAQ